MTLFTRSITETKTISETLRRKTLVFKSLTETSSTSQILNASKTKSESVVISGIVTGLKVRLKALTETVGISSSIRFPFWRRVLRDTKAISDQVSIGGGLIFYKTFTETVLTSGVQAAFKITPELVKISDSLTGLKNALHKILTETTAISGTVTKSLIRLITLTETKSVSDGSGFTTGFTTGFEQIAGLLIKPIRQIVETASISGAVSKKYSFAALLEHISISEKRLRSVIRNISPVKAGLAGISQNTRDFRKVIPTIDAETTLISEAFDKLRNLSASITEDIEIVETFLRNIIPTITAETGIISDAVTLALGQFRTFIETVTITESLVKHIKRKITAEIILITESLLRRIIPKITAQTSVISEDLRATIHGIFISLYEVTDVLETSDALLRTVIPNIVTETLSITESRLRTTIPSILDEVVDIVEVLSTFMSYFRDILEDITISDIPIIKLIPQLATEISSISDSIDSHHILQWFFTEITDIIESIIRQTFSFRQAIEGPCSLYFNGHSSAGTSVQISGIGSLINSVTVTAWVKFLGSEGDYGGVISVINNNVDNRLLLNADGKTILWELDVSGSGIVDFTYTMPDPGFVGDWHHFAASYDGIDMKLYVDGSPVGSPIPAVGSIIAGSSPTIIGWATPQNYHINGNIAEVSEYNLALTDSEISDIFSNGTGSVTRGLIHYWRFNEGSSYIVKDYVGTRDGVIINDPQWSTDIQDPIPNRSIYGGYISESISKSSLLGTITETISSADSLLRTFIPKLFDTTAISESFVRLANFFRTITENSIISDILQIGGVVSLIETISSAESLLRTAIPNIPAEILSLSAYLSRTFTTALQEIITAVDLALCKNEDLNTAWERTTGTDSTLRNIIPIINDTVNITESISRFSAYIISEITAISDSLDRIAQLFWTFTETHSINDIIQATKGIFSFFNISETVDITTSLLRNIVPVIQSEVSTISELLTNLRSVLRSATDITAINEAISSMIFRPFVEVINVVDTQLNKVIPIISAETTTISEAVSNIATYLRTVLEVITISETRLLDIIRNISQTTNIIESSLRQIIPTISVQITTILDSLIGLKGGAIMIIETILISDSLNNLNKLVRALIETRSISESLLRKPIPAIVVEIESISDGLTRLRSVFRKLFENAVSLYFNGSSSVTVPASYTGYTNTITIAGWVKFDDGLIAGGWGGVMSGINSNGNNMISLARPNYIFFRLSLGGIDSGHPIFPTTNIFGDWHFYAFTYDGNSMITYMDGIQVGAPIAAIGNIDSGLAPLSFGTGLDYLIGNIGEIALYNVAKTPTDISNMYVSGMQDDNIVSYYKMNEGVGSIVYDYAGENKGNVNNAVYQADVPPIHTGAIISENIQRLMNRVRTETISILDSILRKAIPKISETISIVDSISRSLIGRVIAQTTSIIESAQRQIIPIIASQVSSISDNVNSLRGRFIQFSEVISISDALSKIASHLMSVSQAIIISETQLRTAIPNIIAQSTTTTESILLGMTRQISETLSIIEQQTRNIMPNILSQVVDIMDSILRVIPNIIQQTTTVAEVIGRAITRPISVQSVSISDILRRIPNKILLETIAISDSINRLANYFRTVTETKLIEELLTVGKNRVSIVLTEAIDITESIQRAITRLITENVSSVDSVVLTRLRQVFNIFLTETIPITDLFARTPGILFHIAIDELRILIRDGGFMSPKGPSWRWLFTPWRDVSFTNLFSPDRTRPHIEPAASGPDSTQLESMSTKPHTGRKSSFTNSFTPKMRGRE